MHSSTKAVLPAMESDREVSLVDLDKGLRSLKKGEQIEAVVSFPALFDKNPFPIVVNSGSLKLVDAFVAGDNFTRASILTVLEQSKRHLDKILNVEEFLKRIHKVVHSNDPVARAVTLRTLGACASILKDKADVHHTIVNALDSHDQIEVEAAIDAAEKFAEQSPHFIINALPKIMSKIYSASVPMKIRCIPILQYVYSSEDATMKVRKICADLLTTHPSLEMVIPVLSTLTRLSARALFDIGDQVKLLLSVLLHDTRRCVRAATLRHLASLISLAPHAITSAHAQVLLSFAVETGDESLCSASLNILCVLASTCAAAIFADVTGYSRLQGFLFHPNGRISAKATELLSELTAKKIRVKRLDFENDHATGGGCDVCDVRDLTYAVESLIILAGTLNRRQILQIALRSAVLLSTVVAIDEIVETCIDAMQCMSDDLKVSTCFFLYKVLPQGQSYVNERVPPLISENDLVSLRGDRDRLVVALWMVLMKSVSTKHDLRTVRTAASFGTSDTVADVEAILANSGAMTSLASHTLGESSSCNAWTAYRIARQAMRHGHASVAAPIIQRLLPKVSSELNCFYLRSLWALCGACPRGDQNMENAASSADAAYKESFSVGDLNRRILWCEKAYLSARALSSHSASMTTGPNSGFYQTYVALYLELLQAHNQLQVTCANFTNYPPPATAAVAAERNATKSAAHLAPQMKKCEADFRALAERYRKVQQTMFDADHESLAHVHWLHDCCLLVAHCLDATVQWYSTAAAAAGSSADSHTIVGTAATPLTLAGEQGELQCLWETFVLARGRKGCGTDSCSAPDIIQGVQSVSAKLSNVPLRVPRYVFQKLQHTQLSINIQPIQKTANEPLLVHADTQLVLKVEGVLTCRTKLSRPLRRVVGMRVTAQSRLLTLPVSSHGESCGWPKGHEPSSTSAMVQETAVLNDYFSVQFLLSFLVVGMHAVDMSCTAVDEDGIEWTITTSAVGTETTTVMVKSYREQAKPQPSQASAKSHGHST